MCGAVHAADELHEFDTRYAGCRCGGSEGTEAAWVRDAATKDVEKWVAHYADDASVLLPDTPILTGKEAIRGGLKPMISDIRGYESGRGEERRSRLHPGNVFADHVEPEDEGPGHGEGQISDSFPEAGRRDVEVGRRYLHGGRATAERSGEVTIAHRAPQRLRGILPQ